MNVIYYSSKKEEPVLNSSFSPQSHFLDALNLARKEKLPVRVAIANTNNNGHTELENLFAMPFDEATRFCSLAIIERFPIQFYLDNDFDRKNMLFDYFNRSKLIALDDAEHIIDDLEQKLDQDKLNEAESNFIHTYMHGRCHLFALVASNLTGLNISVMWDKNADDGEGNFIYQDCLVHAYIKVKDGTHIFDAKGIENLEDHTFDYPRNKEYFTEHDSKEFTKIINDQKWGGFKKGEYAKIEKFIKSNYASQLNLCPDSELSP